MFHAPMLIVWGLKLNKGSKHLTINESTGSGKKKSNLPIFVLWIMLFCLGNLCLAQSHKDFLTCFLLEVLSF